MGKSDLKALVLVGGGVVAVGLLLGMMRGNKWADLVRSGFAA
jgi:hypothetical protein